MTDSEQDRIEAVERGLLDLVAQVKHLRDEVRKMASDRAVARAGYMADARDTGANLAIDTDEADVTLGGLSFWKAKPAAVVGFIGSLIALGVAFGLRLSTEQIGVIMTVVSGGLGLVAMMRTDRTRKSVARAVYRRAMTQKDGGL